MVALALHKRPFDLLVVVFLLVHIPVTLFVDSQAVLPREWYPEPAVNLLDGYVKSLNDPLMKYTPPWFKSLAWLETVFQLPFFVAGSYAYALGRPWIKTPAIIYGISTATTVVPCLAEVAAAALPLNNRLTLMAIYTPYLLIPALMAARMLISEEAFPQRQRQFPKKRN
ncbi:g2826 [Coccomyxa viridis]|uniref:G2826 protein n=1 Tax=Coccomyxa viridis TaxID=1274662 RepID=A0ABP1FRR9_9CHLO